MTTITIADAATRIVITNTGHSNFFNKNKVEIIRSNNLHLRECYKSSINIRILLSKRKILEAQNESCLLVARLEKIRDKLKKSNSELESLCLVAYTLQGNSHMEGGARDAEIALKAFENVLHIDPNNKEAEDKSEDLKFELGLLVPENEDVGQRHGM